ncbi:MAG: amidase, partial [Rhodospirillaceae bacterium]|nr:amidase [Rhodospirillaceae bacterium]
HKPTFGRVPAWPASPFGTLAHIGPITRTVADAALMLNVLALPDHRDWFSVPHDGFDYTTNLDDGVAGLRIAFSPDLGHASVDPEVAALVRAAADVFTDLGGTVEEADPGIGDTTEIFRNHWYAGAATLLAGFSDEQRAVMEAGLQDVAVDGAKLSAVAYLKSATARANIGTRMREFHETYDLLLTPSVPIPAFEVGLESPDPAAQTRWTSWTPFTYPFNLTQQPACSAPCGFTSDGLPVGLQIVGRNFDDALVLRAARAFETARPFQMPGAINVQH